MVALGAAWRCASLTASGGGPRPVALRCRIPGCRAVLASEEQRAEAFFAHLVSVAVAEPVRRAALELQEEEREHVELIKAWMSKVPQPAGDWADDPDPPRYDE